MLGNGVSSSPSNTPMPYDRSRFPHVSVLDQVAAQHKLLTEHFGIAKIALVTGWSMGAGQTYQWAVSHPEMVERAAPFCGSSVTAPHNKVFLESLWTALMADAVFDDGDYSPDRPPVKGLQAFARIYAGWGFSQAFYWAEEWRKMGYTSYEDFRFGFWERFFRDRDPNNLIALLRTWHAADVGATPGFDGDTQAALRSIRCPLLAMPGEKDLYFPPEDEKWASQFIEHGEVLVIPGIWGPSPVAERIRSTSLSSTKRSPACSIARGCPTCDHRIEISRAASMPPRRRGTRWSLRCRGLPRTASPPDRLPRVRRPRPRPCRHPRPGTTRRGCD